MGVVDLVDVDVDVDNDNNSNRRNKNNSGNDNRLLPDNEDKHSQDRVAAVRYVQYVREREAEYLPAIRHLISKDLSEPYSIYVYRYFLYQWGNLCFMAMNEVGELIGVVICKLEPHGRGQSRGYIAMLATQAQHRGRGIATKLVRMAIDAMIAQKADEVALETEVTNTAAMRLYGRLGFLITKRLHRYYLNGNSAFRLLLYLNDAAVSGPNAREQDEFRPDPDSALI